MQIRMLRVATLFHQVFGRLVRLPNLHQLLLVAVMFVFAKVCAKAALAVIYMHHDLSSLQ